MQENWNLMLMNQKFEVKFLINHFNTILIMQPWIVCCIRFMQRPNLYSSIICYLLLIYRRRLKFLSASKNLLYMIQMNIPHFNLFHLYVLTRCWPDVFTQGVWTIGPRLRASFPRPRWRRVWGPVGQLPQAVRAHPHHTHRLWAHTGLSWIVYESKNI